MTNPTATTPTANSSAIVVFDIDGVVRDVGGSYRRALADTVEHFTGGAYRPSSIEIDDLKAEGIWNNDWEGSQELVYRYFEAQGQERSQIALDYDTLVAFFQSRYRGPNPENWTGYICTEPLLLQPRYLENLTEAGILWGFFSGATRGSATYVLEKRLGLQSPVLLAMEDAPGKPDPTGLVATIEQIKQRYPVVGEISVIYVGDTVADMYTIEKAKALYPERRWIGVGILPPHVQETGERRTAYEEILKEAGAVVVFSNVEQLNADQIQRLVINSSHA
ncbi:TIGR01548 family HAD-type hydrolase [Microcoleus sp. FACHB-SPT15]|uniref:TIGR01548 family HAD-type hydrolase n=1 Tax=Microcoleus sp. FACHB-SPT15 TaxID=2692830 RepID=UPI0017814CB8|nr:TIGR01548 family HAD-type hydrolase [Microcoleus sp. FACHB-SPT15]MBD1808797.1 TIGR01548 family HAD-type hydrolase [Microcoleus sp. FACHB-SPT15]